MKMDQSDVQTVIALAFIVIVALAVYPAKLIETGSYVALLLTILAIYGIQTYRALKAQGTRIRDLLPGFLTDKELVGLFGMIMITWLYGNYAMPYDQWYSLMLLILGSLGLLHLHLYQVTRIK